jgi:formate hydrogenlyase transcriptional activator
MAGESGFASHDLIPFALPDSLSDPGKLLAAYFSASTVGLCILDSQLRYLAINNALAQMNGVPAPSHLGRTVREVLGKAADVLEPGLRQVFATGQPMGNVEISVLLNSRTEPGHWIEHFFPVADANGVITRIGVVAVEVTEQRKLRESLHELTGKSRRQMERLQMLLEVSSILAFDRNVQQIFPRISARIRRVVLHEFAGLLLHDDQSGHLMLRALDFPLGKGPLLMDQMVPENSPGARSLRERACLILSTDELRDFDPQVSRQFLDEGLHSLCCVPLLGASCPLGVLVLGSTRREVFQQEDVILLRQVATQLAVAIENYRAAAEIEALKERVTEEKKYLEGEISAEGNFAEIIGQSPALRNVLSQVQTVATSNATVLILGETGTGKELIARAVHHLSKRRERAFIKVNCAAIPTGLLESELFGHEKGAFTGAVLRKIGRMELADGGTLFLDEVGEIPLELQPKLLRVLQDQEFERLGGIRTTKVNVRLIAATNRDLARSVSEHQYRSDLFYRLNVFPIRMPPLRDRPEDIPVLVRYFVHKYARRMDRRIETISRASMNALMRWNWQGNVRELENFIERSVILSEGPALCVPLAELALKESGADSQDQTLDNAEREHIIRTLHETKGQISGPGGAAHRLGLKRTTLQSKMQRLKISREDYSGPK